MGSRPIALAVWGRKTPNAVGLLPSSEKARSLGFLGKSGRCVFVGSRPIALAVWGRKTPNAVGLLPFSEKSPCMKGGNHV